MLLIDDCNFSLTRTGFFASSPKDLSFRSVLSLVPITFANTSHIRYPFLLQKLHENTYFKYIGNYIHEGNKISLLYDGNDNNYDQY